LDVVFVIGPNGVPWQEWGGSENAPVGIAVRNPNHTTEAHKETVFVWTAIDAKERENGKRIWDEYTFEEWCASDLWMKVPPGPWRNDR
jgi:hypothetical protein